MNKYVKETIELIKSLEEEEILEILLSEKRDNPVELMPFINRDKITLGIIVHKFRPEVVEKYKLLIDEKEDEEQYYDD
jgi:hypothetical protein